MSVSASSACVSVVGCLSCAARYRGLLTEAWRARLQTGEAPEARVPLASLESPRPHPDLANHSRFLPELVQGTLSFVRSYILIFILKPHV